MSGTSMKQIKNRIRSVQGTMQITRAMQLVAASRMRKMTERIEKAKPYFTVLSETLSDIAANNLDFSSPYTREKQGATCHIVIAGDRGLAGGYNHNLFKSLNIADGDIIFPIGKKTVEHFSAYPMISEDYEKAADVTITDCKAIAELIIDAFDEGKFTRLTLSYTSFKNMLTQEPKTVELLPIRSGQAEVDEKHELTIYEPGAEGAFAQIIPYYISGMIYGAVTESVTSETAARRNAMETATDNASEMIDSLTLEYNRARQAAVTQELTEIVSGVQSN